MHWRGSRSSSPATRSAYPHQRCTGRRKCPPHPTKGAAPTPHRELPTRDTPIHRLGLHHPRTRMPHALSARPTRPRLRPRPPLEPCNRLSHLVVVGVADGGLLFGRIVWADVALRREERDDDALLVEHLLRVLLHPREHAASERAREGGGTRGQSEGSERGVRARGQSEGRGESEARGRRDGGGVTRRATAQCPHGLLPTVHVPGGGV
jgi:GAF domain-containing protein